MIALCCGETWCYDVFGFANCVMCADAESKRLEERKKNQVPDLPPKPQLNVKSALAAAASASSAGATPTPTTATAPPNSGAGPSASALPPARKAQPPPPPPPLPKHIHARVNARSDARAPALVFVLPPLPVNARALLSPSSAANAAAGPSTIKPVNVNVRSPPAPLKPTPTPSPSAAAAAASAAPPPVPPKPVLPASTAAAAVAGNEEKSSADSDADAEAAFEIDADEYSAYHSDWYATRMAYGATDPSAPASAAATAAAAQQASVYALEQYHRLRPVSEYLSGVFWARDALKQSHCSFQKRLIPRSLTIFDADTIEVCAMAYKQLCFPQWTLNNRQPKPGAIAAAVAAAQARVERRTLLEPERAKMMAKALMGHAVANFESECLLCLVRFVFFFCVCSYAEMPCDVLWRAAICRHFVLYR